MDGQAEGGVGSLWARQTKTRMKMISSSEQRLHLAQTETLRAQAQLQLEQLTEAKLSFERALG